MRVKFEFTLSTITFDVAKYEILEDGTEFTDFRSKNQIVFESGVHWLNLLCKQSRINFIKELETALDSITPTLAEIQKAKVDQNTKPNEP